jgi:hypothetical protein
MFCARDGAAVDRAFEFHAGGRVLTLPCFFPAVSSAKTNLMPIDYLCLLLSTGFPQFLISAYDIRHASPAGRSEMREMLQRAYDKGTVILLDSGKYESYWRRDATWNLEAYRRVCANLPIDFAFSFDNQDPVGAAKALAKEVERSVFRTGGAGRRGTVLPIVHAPSDSLPNVCAQVVDRLQPIMVAVPERELGDGLLERAETIARIRAAIDEAGYYCLLHLLGTGNPLSILAYSACGADSFDGLEWCQTCVHPRTAVLHHFHQLDLVLGDAPDVAGGDLPYPARVILHNLQFFSTWLPEISECLRAGSWGELAARYIPQRIRSRVLDIGGRR